MTNLELIRQKLPTELWEKAENFNIPESFLDQNADLVVLILNSRSLENNEEKQSRFNLVPMMNSEQIDKLRDILTRERDKIAEIEAKYEQKKEEIRDKYQQRFDAVAYNNKISVIRDTEAAQREQEAADVENLFDDL